MTDSPETAIAEPSVVAAEMTRRRALNAMGIPVYVSRYDWPGASPAVRQTRPSPSSSMDVPDSVSAPVSVLESVPVIESASRGQGTVPADSVDSVAPADRALTSAAVRFSMLLVSAGPCLWVEQLDDGLIRQGQLALIHGMARAITSDNVTLMQQQFDWPVKDHSAMRSDAESATQALHGLIQRMAREANAKRIVVMGECPFLPERMAQSAVLIPSTLSMLADAVLKREAWQALKPLRTIDLS